MRGIDRLVRFSVTSMLPAVDGQPGAGEAGLDEFLARMLREAPVPWKVGVVGASALFVVLPPLTIGVPLPAPLLPHGLRDRHAYRMATHRLYLVRQAGFLLKMVGGLCWGADPEVRRRFGLKPYAADPGTWRAS